MFLFLFSWGKNKDPRAFQMAHEHHLPDWSDRNFWNGDGWLEAFSFFTFVFRRIWSEAEKKRGTQLRPHFVCWCDHAQVIRVMLQQSLSLDEIDRAEGKCRSWRRQAVALVLVEAFRTQTRHFPAMAGSLISKIWPPNISTGIESGVSMFQRSARYIQCGVPTFQVSRCGLSSRL